MRHSKRLTPKGYFGAGSAREMVSTLLQLGQTVYQRELVFPYRNASVAGGWGGDQQVNGILKAPSVCNRSAVKKSTQRKVPRCRRKSRFHHRPCIKTESQIQAYRQPVSLSLPSSNFFFFFSSSDNQLPLSPSAVVGRAPSRGCRAPMAAAGPGRGARFMTRQNG